MHSTFSIGIELSLVESQKASDMCSCNSVFVVFLLLFLLGGQSLPYMEISQQQRVSISIKRSSAGSSAISGSASTTTMSLLGRHR